MTKLKLETQCLKSLTCLKVETIINEINNQMIENDKIGFNETNKYVFYS